MVVLCVVGLSKKAKCRTIKEPSTDEVRNTREYKKKTAESVDVCLICLLCYHSLKGVLPVVFLLYVI